MVAVTGPDTHVGQIVQECGVIVSPNDSHGSVNAIQLLIGGEQKWITLGQAERAYAISTLGKRKPPEAVSGCHLRGLLKLCVHPIH